MKTDLKQRSGRTWSFVLVLESDLVARSLQEGGYRTIVDRDEDRPAKALQEQKISCQHVVGAESLVLMGGLVGAVLVTVCVSLLRLQATQQCLLVSRLVIVAEVVSKLRS